MGRLLCPTKGERDGERADQASRGEGEDAGEHPLRERNIEANGDSHEDVPRPTKDTASRSPKLFIADPASHKSRTDATGIPEGWGQDRTHARCIHLTTKICTALFRRST